MTRKLSRLRDFGTMGLDSKVLTWSQRVCEQTEANFADQQSQLDTINAILDDNTLTPDKKPVWIFMETYLTGEQAALDSEATTYGITTEKTNYDNAISAMTTYLATLTSPVAWNNLTGNTTISGPTLRSNFNSVLTTKQALLNKMHDTARSLANTAQSTANTANTNAAAAQSTANTANTTANTAKKNDKISASATSPTTVLSAFDAGSSASITIAAHTRIYGDNTSVSGVASHTITGLSYSTTYGIYYDDPTTSTTSPTYVATSTLSDAMPNKANGRHYVGQVTTPASGGGSTSGGGVPPGGGGPYP